MGHALTTEAFSVEATKGYDVVFLAASGDFAIKYAREIGKGLSGEWCGGGQLVGSEI